MVEEKASASEYTLIAKADSPIGDAVVKRLGASRALVLNGTDEGRLRGLITHCRHAQLWLHDLADVPDISVSLGRLLRDSKITIRALVHCGDAGPSPDAGNPPHAAAFAAPVFSGIELIRTLRRRDPNRAALAGVVFASSSAGRRPLMAAAQGAIEAFSRSAAVELVGKCRLNCLVSTTAPSTGESSVATESLPLATDRGEAIAAAVEFLLSDGASGITGQRLVVDSRTSHTL